MKINQYKLDPTLNWNLAEIVSINNNKINFKTIDKNAKNFEGTLNLKEIKWTISQKKSIQDIHNIGDIFFVAKNNNWEIKQYPKVNGGIVVMILSVVIF